MKLNLTLRDTQAKKLPHFGTKRAKQNNKDPPALQGDLYSVTFTPAATDYPLRFTTDSVTSVSASSPC